MRKIADTSEEFNFLDSNQRVNNLGTDDVRSIILIVMVLKLKKIVPLFYSILNGIRRNKNYVLPGGS